LRPARKKHEPTGTALSIVFQLDLSLARQWGMFDRKFYLGFGEHGGFLFTGGMAGGIGSGS
jgi:hypothetical protein